MSEANTNNITDAILLEQLRDGNVSAFNSLFERYWQKAFSDAFKRLYNEEDAKDIVQEIFVYLWLNRETIQIQNLPAYIHVAVRNKVLKLVSARKTTHPFYDLLEDVAMENTRADSRLLWKEFSRTYEALVSSLPPKRQEIFRLRYQEDFSTTDIAERMGITRKTVQNQLGKAIDTLKTMLLHLFFIIAFMTCL